MTEFQIELKQRSGKWAPQCIRDSRESAQEAFEHMRHMKRKLRVVKIEDGLRQVVAKWEPAS